MKVVNSGTAEININGKTHKATYKVWKDVVTVSYHGKTKSTQVGGLEVEAVARLLLREMIDTANC